MDLVLFMAGDGAVKGSRAAIVAGTAKADSAVAKDSTAEASVVALRCTAVDSVEVARPMVAADSTGAGFMAAALTVVVANRPVL
jgi:hypothetical protein